MRNLGQKTERQILKKIGARRQPGSGAIPGLPNDGVKNRYLIEVKSTVKASLGLKKKWLEDLEENALRHGKIPALIIVFNKIPNVGGSAAMRAMGDRAERQEWVAIPRWRFECLTKGWRRQR